MNYIQKQLGEMACDTESPTFYHPETDLSFRFYHAEHGLIFIEVIFNDTFVDSIYVKPQHILNICPDIILIMMDETQDGQFTINTTDEMKNWLIKRQANATHNEYSAKTCTFEMAQSLEESFCFSIGHFHSSEMKKQFNSPFFISTQPNPEAYYHLKDFDATEKLHELRNKCIESVGNLRSFLKVTRSIYQN